MVLGLTEPGHALADSLFNFWVPVRQPKTAMAAFGFGAVEGHAELLTTCPRKACMTVLAPAYEGGSAGRLRACAQTVSQRRLMNAAILAIDRK
jgi:hypothetical protein